MGSDPQIQRGGDGRHEASSAVMQPIPEKLVGAPGAGLETEPCSVPGSGALEGIYQAGGTIRYAC